MIIGVSGKISSGKDMTEIWKKCSFNSDYEVSSLSKIRSKGRYVNAKNNSKAFKSSTILKQNSSQDYLTVGLSSNGILKTYLVHILVATEFVENPYNLPCVNHEDGNKRNNLPLNLKWTTYSNNMLHAAENNLTQIGQRYYNSKLTNIQVLEIKEKYKTGNYTHASLGKEYNVTKQNITMILNNKSRRLC